MEGAGDKLELEIMRLGVDYNFPVKIGELTIRLRPLASSEMVNCYSEVAAYMATLPKSYQNEVTENTARAREFLKQASSPFGQFAPQLTEHHLGKMTNGQIMAVYKEWISITEKVNPELEKMSEEQIKNLIDYVKKNRPTDLDYQLTELSFGQLRSLAQYFLTKEDSPQDKSSGG